MHQTITGSQQAMRREMRIVAIVAVPLSLYAIAVVAFLNGTLAPYVLQFRILAQIAAMSWVAVAAICFICHLFLEWRRTGVMTKRPIMALVSFLRQRWEYDRLISALTPPLMFVVLLTIFGAFKQLILPRAGFHFDPAIAAADRALFGGRNAWEVTHMIFSSPKATMAIDWVYHSWFLPMSVGVMLCGVLRGRPDLRAQYLLAYLLVWILIGSVLAFAYTSAGPAYYGDFVSDNNPFTALIERLRVQQTALPHYQIQALLVQKGLRAYFGQPMIGTGISAMPSMHVSLAVLFACAAWSLGRVWGKLATGYVVLIWIGSIHLGWHYALDGIAAAPLAAGVWLASGIIVRQVLAIGQASTQRDSIMNEAAI